MTPSTRDILLGGATFAVPELPHRYNRVVYPLCRDLSADPENEDSFLGRLVKAHGTPDVAHDDEWDKLADIAFQAACAADKTLTRDQFDDLPIKPQEFIDAFFVIRLQTGVWRTADDAAAPTEGLEQGESTSGEAAGA